MHPRIAAAALMLIASLSTASAQEIPKGEYKIDPQHTQIVFGIKHMGLSTFYGTAGEVTGTLIADPATPAKSTLDVTVDLTKVYTHVDKLTGELRDDVFKTAKFPTANFKITNISTTDNKTGTVTGDLTLRGITKPVTLNVTFNGGRAVTAPQPMHRLGFDASTTIKRSDFALTDFAWSAFVGDEVTLLIEAEFQK